MTFLNHTQVYTCEMDLDVDKSIQNNIHNRLKADIVKAYHEWVAMPSHHLYLDCAMLLNPPTVEKQSLDMENISNDGDDDVVMQTEEDAVDDDEDNDAVVENDAVGEDTKENVSIKIFEKKTLKFLLFLMFRPIYEQDEEEDEEDLLPEIDLLSEVCSCYTIFPIVFVQTFRIFVLPLLLKQRTKLAL